MVRNGFVEKFAVLRLSKILDGFVKSGTFESHEYIDCKPTRVFYDVEDGFYGIHMVFYVKVDKTEEEVSSKELLGYMKDTVLSTTKYITKRHFVKKTNVKGFAY